MDVFAIRLQPVDKIHQAKHLRRQENNKTPENTSATDTPGSQSKHPHLVSVLSSQLHSINLALTTQFCSGQHNSLPFLQQLEASNR